MTTHELPDDPAILKPMIVDLVSAIQDKERRIAALEHQLHLHLAYRYGPRSEKLSPDQMLLFDTATPQEAEPAPAPTPQEPAQTPKPGNGHGRKRLPAELPRVRVEYPIPEAERTCPGCKEVMARIGEDVSEQLDFKPANLFVRQHVRPKYACKTCQDGVLTAPKPAAPIDKGLPGPGLLAHVVASKYADHLPLYRQQKIYARQNVEIAESTLCDWIASAAELALPVWEAQKADVLAGRKIHSDDTPVPVLDADRKHTRQGRNWVYVGDDEHPQVVFEYTPDRRKERPAEFLGDWKGYLQADAYGGYDGIYAGNHVIEVACWAHARRKFFEAQDTDRARATAALVYIQKLYEVEREAKGKPSDERKRLRQEQSRPILDDFKRWLSEQTVAVLPKSPMGEAIQYATNQWTALTRYLDDGILDIDNNAAERALRCVAIGRKNWLFAGSDEGGRRSAILYSLVETCKLHKIDPFEYLRDIFDRLPTYPTERMIELTPPRWKAARQAVAAEA